MPTPPRLAVGRLVPPILLGLAFAGAPVLAPAGAAEESLLDAARSNDRSVAEIRDVLRDPTAQIGAASERLYYVDAGSRSGSQSVAEAAPTTAFPLGDTFALHSKADSDRTIYLDFDGTEVVDTGWNADFGVASGFHAGWDPVGNGAEFTDSERAAIQDVFLRVAEDYAPFDVDVTTEEPTAAKLDRSAAADRIFGVRVLISDSDNAWRQICDRACGGVSYLDVFDEAGTSGYYRSSWVFPDGLSNDSRNVAETVAHEAGHAFGLEHDGNTVGSPDYDTGRAPWAPIMGAGFDQPITQWSKGDYPNANNQEDDLAIIAASGAPQRVDEAGSSITGARPLPTSAAYISSRADVDVYALGSCTGTIDLVARPAEVGPNLDIELRLLDATGATVALDNPPAARSTRSVATGLSASLTRELSGGPYFAAIDGVGNADPSTGYDDYGSLGAYTLSVSGCSTDPEPPGPGDPSDQAGPTDLVVVVVDPVTAPTTTTTPGAPRIGGAKSGRRGGKSTAKIRWRPPTSDGGSSITKYQVVAYKLRGKRTVKRFKTRVPASTHGLVITLPRGTYRFAVRAQSAAGASPLSPLSKRARAR